jgi:Flp pilus assembly protein TadG
MRRGARSGHAMLELALSAGVLVACLSGTFQFGYAFYVYNQLVTAVGNGGRYAAMRTYRTATPQDVEKGRTAIRNLVVYGDAQPGADAAPVVPNLSPEQVRVEWTLDGSGAPSAVEVGIASYDVNAVFRTFTLTGRPEVEFPYVGRYAPAEREP